MFAKSWLGIWKHVGPRHKPSFASDEIACMEDAYGRTLIEWERAVKIFHESLRIDSKNVTTEPSLNVLFGQDLPITMLNNAK